MIDFFDPRARRWHTAKLITAYIFSATAIILATLLLMDIARGFGLHKGQVVQNGLVFVSSTPSGSQIKLNGVSQGATGARLQLQAGTYTMTIERAGYRTWQRAVTIEGSSVERFDYPFLFPAKLQTVSQKPYDSAPSLATQSPDRRWILVEQPGSLTSFDMFDVKNPKQVKSSTVTLPDGLLTASTDPQSLQLVKWSNDNQHALLEHLYGANHEYIMVDAQKPAQSLNLTKSINLNTTEELSMQNDVYDHYFIYDAATDTLSTAVLNKPNTTTLLTHVLAYKTYGTNIVLYVTDQNVSAGPGHVNVVLYQNNKNYPLRSLDTDKTYLLNLTQYGGAWFVAAGSASEGRVYVYKNPLDSMQNSGGGVAPITVLRIDQPNYLDFSASAQFIVTENGSHFAVYDAEYDKTYVYSIDAPLDAPQPHATWMDGDRLTYISNGKLVVFDYDSANFQTLQPANSSYLPFFDQTYHKVYTMATAAATSKTPAQTQLTNTWLLTPADQ